MITNSTS